MPNSARSRVVRVVRHPGERVRADRDADDQVAEDRAAAATSRQSTTTTTAAASNSSISCSVWVIFFRARRRPRETTMRALPPAAPHRASAVRM